MRDIHQKVHYFGYAGSIVSRDLKYDNMTIVNPMLCILNILKYELCEIMNMLLDCSHDFTVHMCIKTSNHIFEIRM